MFINNFIFLAINYSFVNRDNLNDVELNNENSLLIPPPQTSLNATVINVHNIDSIIKKHNFNTNDEEYEMTLQQSTTKNIKMESSLSPKVNSNLGDELNYMNLSSDFNRTELAVSTIEMLFYSVQLFSPLALSQNNLKF